jgi:ligand-binding sensor domain-containing protein/serine phosphatase RsbU (regulator of sigma subunit)
MHIQDKLLIALLLCCFTATAQVRNYHFKKLHVNDGLSCSTINHIFRDSKGFIWVSTPDGLNRFDGYSFTVFRSDPRDSTAISSNWCGYIYEDNKGYLWIETHHAIDRYDPRTSTFRKWKFPGISPPYRSSGINKWNENELLLGLNNSIYIFNPEKNSMAMFLDSTKLNVERKRVEPKQFLVGKDGKLWVMMSWQYVYSYDPVSGAVKRFITDDKRLGFNGRMYEDTGGNILVGMFGENTQGGLLVLEDKHNGKFRMAGLTHPEFPRLGEAIGFLQQDMQGRYWMGGWNMPLTQFSLDDKVVYTVFSEAMDPQGIGNFRYYPVGLIDSTNTFWRGGEGTELMYFNPASAKFTHYSRIPNVNSLSDNAVWGISENSRRQLFIATGNGLNVCDLETGRYTIYQHDPADPTSIPSNMVYKVVCDSKDRVWVTTAGYGFARFYPETGKFKRFTMRPDNPQSWPKVNAFEITEAKSGMIYIGSWSKGLVRLDPEKETFEVFSHDPADPLSIRNNRVHTVREDPSGKLYIGTQHGLDRFDPVTSTFEHISDPKHPDVLKHEIRDIHIENASSLWIANGENGLLHFNPSKGVVREYLRADGLPNEVIYSILPDSKGHLWLSTNNGLSRLNMSTGTFTNYDYSDGLQSNEFNSGARAIGRDGALYFGGINGMNKFYPDSITSDLAPPRIWITHLKINNEEVVTLPGEPTPGEIKLIYRNGKQYLPVTAEYLQKLFLNYNENNVSFDFVALHFGNPEKNRYACMLEGYESSWNMLGNRRFVSYTNLNPGTYTFRVKASNFDGVWNEKGVSLQIVIAPPFWQTWWFRLLSIGLAGAVIAGAFKWRTAYLEKENRILEKKVNERTAELNISNAKLSEAITDIRDSINYAKRIQEAILPSKEIKYRIFPDAFVMFKPRDVVSGDFYWFGEKNDKRLIAAVDCTGHGVPGAFMSMIGNAFLNEIIMERGITAPAKILDELRSMTIKALKQTGVSGQTADGMDISLLCFDDAQQTVEYAGANNPLWMIRNNDLTEIKGDKQPIGYHKGTVQPFSSHTIPYHPGDCFYIFTDGYADQFGGDKGKKFKYKPMQELLLAINSKPMLQQEQVLNATIEEWRGNLEQVDDILVIGVRV